MNWLVILSKTAEKDLRQVDVATRARVAKALHRYATEGYGDIETIKPFCGEYRLRVGDLRVLFALDYSSGQLVVQHVRHRREVYR